ncbi:MAG: hypothetical protein WD426_04150 [Anditalea sp.]
MLKYTFETKDQELKAWVEPANGSFNVQIGMETVKIPHEIGVELISVIKQKQSSFKEVERKKLSAWNKFLDMVAGQGKGGFWGTSWSEI